MNRTLTAWITFFCCTVLVISSRAEDAKPLSLKQALSLAEQNHPVIAAAQLSALAAAQQNIEARSAYFPIISANATAAGTGTDANNTRFAAGGLNNPIIFERNAEGLQVNQLLTDFGRTANLSASTKLHARAEETNAMATRAEIALRVASAYFLSLELQSVREVARQTVATRQLLVDQVEVLATNQIKSQLDVSFAQVSRDEGKLLLQKAENDFNASLEILSTLMGYRDRQLFKLIEEPMPAELQGDPSQFVSQALKDRPELVRLRLERDAAEKFAKAEKSLQYPSISAVGGVGIIPVHDSHLRPNYAAAGVNLNLPIFSGNLYTARSEQAQLEAKRAGEVLRDAENNVMRDVRISLLNVNYAREHLDLTAKLLESASLAFTLARERYKQGSSSIVELSEAQLNMTSAEIAQTSAKYQYLIERANLNYQIGARLN